jgi:hypothetical protein
MSFINRSVAAVTFNIILVPACNVAHAALIVARDRAHRPHP